MLRARLLDEHGDLAPELHRRASAWYQQHDGTAGAIRHAIAAEDFDRAADLIELAAPAMRQDRQETTLRAWLDALPDEVFVLRPLLAIAHVGALLASGELRGVEARLDDAERWVDAALDEQARAAAEAAGMIVVDRDTLAHIPSAIALYRAALARMRGDLRGTIAFARRVLEVATPDQTLERGGAAGMLGLAYWTSGDLAAAHDAWAEAAVSLERAGHLADVLGCSIAMADIRIVQGDLQEARRTYERGLQLGAPVGEPPLRGVADMHVGMSELDREWNDLVVARRHLEASAALGEAMGLPQNAYRSRVAMSRVLEAEGDVDVAIGMLDDAERVYDGDFFPEVRPISAMRARLWIAQGRLGEAAGWAAQRDLSADDDPGYLREYEHITLARLLLARGLPGGDDSPPAPVERLLSRLLDAAEGGGRERSVIEILLLQALLRRAGGDEQGAAASIDRALARAEAGGYVRLFVDEGPPMATLLRGASKRVTTPRYVARLLAAFGGQPARTASSQAMVEPLSDREVEVLRLLDTDLDGPEIARELVVSVNTLRTHTKNIYAKLGVNSRRAAVSRAVELS